MGAECSAPTLPPPSGPLEPQRGSLLERYLASLFGLDVTDLIGVLIDAISGLFVLGSYLLIQPLSDNLNAQLSPEWVPVISVIILPFNFVIGQIYQWLVRAFGQDRVFPIVFRVVEVSTQYSPMPPLTAQPKRSRSIMPRPLPSHKEPHLRPLAHTCTRPAPTTGEPRLSHRRLQLPLCCSAPHGGARDYHRLGPHRALALLRCLQREHGLVRPANVLGDHGAASLA